VGSGPLVSARARRERAALAAIAIAIAITSGCGAGGSYRLDRGIRRAALSTEDAARQKSLVAEGDRLWAERTNPARLAAALARWESAVAIQDDDWATYARLAQGYFFQAEAVFGFQSSAGTYPYDGGDGSVDPQAARRFRDALRRGFTVALRGMAARSRELEQRLQAGIDMEEAVRVVGKDAAALVYWYAVNLARWARATGLRALIRARRPLVACLFHLRRIDPAYFHAGADRLLGVYFAAAPSMVGGDLDRARAHFDAAQRAAPSYLANLVLAAEFLDRKARNRAAFEGRLRRVLGRPDFVAPDLAPENAVERRKARAMLERVDSYFGR
jgi:TRAP transporter T-component